VAEGSPQDLTRLVGRVVELEVYEDELPDSYRRFVVTYRNGHVTLRIPESIVDDLKAHTVEERSVQPTLEDVYVSLVGESSMDVRPYQFRRGGTNEWRAG